MRPRIGEAQSQENDDPPSDRPKRVVPGRSALMKANTPKDGPSKAVAPPAIDRILSEHEQHQEQDRRGEILQPFDGERDADHHHIDWRQHRNRDQKSNKEFDAASGIFETFAADLSIGPQIATHVRDQPEAIDSKRHRHQGIALDEQSPIIALLSDELGDHAGWSARRLRVWNIHANPRKLCLDRSSGSRTRPTARQLWINAIMDSARLCHKQLWTPV